MTSNAMSLSFIYQTIQPKSVKGTQFFPNSPSPNLLHKVSTISLQSSSFAFLNYN
ncbi:hypothetical protein Hanom_Chr09g00775671 [Helianthus anomalus]